MSRNRTLTGNTLTRIKVALYRRMPVCRHCGRRLQSIADCHLDHIVPISAGGTDDASNLQLLCIECHVAKTALDCGRRPRRRIGPDGYPLAD